jgi:hypothetical protein
VEGDGAEAELADAAEKRTACLQAELGFAERVEHRTKGARGGVGVPDGSAAHEELVEVHDHAADGGPGGERREVGSFVGRSERHRGHLGGLGDVGAIVGERLGEQGLERLEFAGVGFAREAERVG